MISHKGLENISLSQAIFYVILSYSFYVGLSHQLLGNDTNEMIKVCRERYILSLLSPFETLPMSNCLQGSLYGPHFTTL